MKKFLRHAGLVFFAGMMMSLGIILFGMWLAILWEGFCTAEGSAWVSFILLVFIPCHPHVREIYQSIRDDLRFVQSQW